MNVRSYVSSGIASLISLKCIELSRFHTDVVIEFVFSLVIDLVLYSSYKVLQFILFPLRC